MKKGIVVILGLSELLLLTSPALAQKPPPEQQIPFIYDDQAKRDPFWTLVGPGGAIISYEQDLAISDMALEGIIVGEDDENIAIINGIIVQPNDKIGVFIIKKIKPGSVVLQKGEQNFILKLKKEE